MDLIFIGAHPDDAEIFAGGLIALCVKRGYDVGVVHLTQGERATRGTVGERAVEAANAAAALGVAPERMRILDLGDTRLENTEENRAEIIRVLRDWRPRVVFCHDCAVDRHPDHGKAGRLAEDASLYCRLKGIATGGQEPFAPQARHTFLYSGPRAGSPSFVVDVSETFEQKLEALRAYRSQFHNPSYEGDTTFISSPEFWEQVETRARYFGGLIGSRYGEPFLSPSPLAVTDPGALLSGK